MMTDLTLSPSYQDMRPADRVVALSALADAIKTEISVQKQNALELAEQVGVKSFSTRFGALNVTQKDAPILINEFELFDWVKTNQPELIETVEQIPEWHVRALSDPKRFVVVDGDVIDSTNGEVVSYATVDEKPAPFIAWPASKEQKAAKELAREFVSGNAQTLAGTVLALGE